MTLKSVTQIQRMFLQLPHSHKILISAISVALLLLLIIPSEPATASKNSTPAEQLMPGKRYQLELAFEQSNSNENSESSELTWQTYQVKSGDSLAKIFSKVGFSAQQLYRVTESGDEAKYLRKVHPGDLLRFATDGEGELVQLAHQIPRLSSLLVKATTL